jgi:hypothetical protein
MQYSWSAKIGFGLLVAAWLVFGANMVGNALVHVKNPEKPAYQVVSGDAEDKDEAKKEEASKK